MAQALYYLSQDDIRMILRKVRLGSASSHGDLRRILYYLGMISGRAQTFFRILLEGPQTDLGPISDRAQAI